MNIPQLQKKLFAWYRKNRRSLPWRNTNNAYHIWISEVMLQQTQVNTVIPYYLRFIERFPNIESLPRADPEARDVARGPISPPLPRAVPGEPRVEFRP